MTGYSEEIFIREALGETIRSLTENQDERNQMIREACSMLYGFDRKYKAEFNKIVEILESFLVQYNPENVTLNLFDSKTHKTILRNKVLQKSAQLAITAHLWSSCSTEKYVDNLLLLQKDGRAAISCTGLIEAYLNTGLCYDTHQIVFDRALERIGSFKGIIFPRARYPALTIRKTKAEAALYLGIAKHGHRYERTIPVIAEEISALLHENKSGIYPFFSLHGKKQREMLCTVLIKDQAYFYLKHMNRYYMFKEE